MHHAHLPIGAEPQLTDGLGRATDGLGAGQMFGSSPGGGLCGEAERILAPASLAFVSLN